MPAESTYFRKKEIGFNPTYVGGQNQVPETTTQREYGNVRSGAQFAITTGDKYGFIPDVVYNQSSNVVLIPDADVPYGMRCHITSASFEVLGQTAWTGGTSVVLTDGTGAPQIFLPTTALVPLATYLFPDSDQSVPIIITASSYVASTGVVTFPSTSLVSTSYVNNAVATVIAGTGMGQSEIIASNTATTITPVRGASAWPQGLDNTSVFAISYWAATAGSTTTITLANQEGSATPLTVNALDNNYNAVVVAGTAVGGNRVILLNSTSVVTVANAYNTAPAAGSLIHISNEPNLRGALDLSVGQQWNSMSANSGLQVAVNGTFTAGSNIRVSVQGYFGF